MFDRQKIMTQAWERYRKQLSLWKYEKYTFADCLRTAWVGAYAERDPQYFAKQLRAVRAFIPYVD